MYFCSTGTCLYSARHKSSWINGLTEAQCPPELARATSLTPVYGKSSNCQESLECLPYLLYTSLTVYDTNHKDYDPTTPLCSQDTCPPLSHVLNLQCSCYFLCFTQFVLHSQPSLS